ncbi:MAG: glycosyltransferase [Deltaproteobacteria bacterium]|nr:glycosyltransferase [Deltaproteobacteria bacterium]
MLSRLKRFLGRLPWLGDRLRRLKARLTGAPRPRPRLDYGRWRTERLAARAGLYPAPANDPPGFTILTLTYNTPAAVLRQTAASVLAQDYPHFAWLIWDNGSQEAATRGLLAELDQDPRVTVHLHPENLGITRGHQAALELATGPYVALLDHDDLLTPDALRIMAWHIARHGEPDFLYSDEDKCDERGRHFYPVLKPDPSPALLACTAYPCHFSVARLAVMREVAAFSDPGVEGTQDWDLALRMFDHGGRVVHVPEVLYAWRVVAASTAGGVAAKPYVIQAQRHALEASLARRGLTERFAVQPSPLFPFPEGHWHPWRRPEAAPPLVDVVVVAGGLAETLATVEELWLATDYPGFRLRLWDPLGREELARALAPAREALAGRLFIEAPDAPEPLNLPAVLNRALAQPPAEAPAAPYLAWWPLGVRTLTRRWLWEGLGSLELDSGAVMAGGVLLDARDRFAGGAAILGLGGEAQTAYLGREAAVPGFLHLNLCLRNVGALRDAPWLLRRELAQELGGFDPAFPRQLWEADFCARAVRAGRRLVHNPLWPARGRRPAPVPAGEPEVDLFLARHRDILRDDPFYSPYLSLDPEGAYELATPAQRAQVLAARLGQLWDREERSGGAAAARTAAPSKEHYEFFRPGFGGDEGKL